MPRHIRPLLHNGFQIRDDVVVRKRIDKAFFTEIYELSDGNCLYIFTNLRPEDGEKKLEHFNKVRLHLPDADYIGIITPDYSLTTITRVLDSMKSGMGLDSVAGMKVLKEILIKDVIQPLLNPAKFKKFKISMPNGILLYGPPGCGKTFIVRKLAEELNYHFMEVKHADITSSYIHESASRIAAVFEKAKIQSPTILFFDEIEGIVPKRETLEFTAHYKQEEVNELLRQLNDAGKNNILVVAATNRPQLIDPAILRAGRMDKRIYVPPPDPEARKELFMLYLSGIPHVEGIDFDRLSGMTEGFVCSDIELIVSESAREAVDKNLPEIDQKMIELEILKSVPSVTRAELEKYRAFGEMERY
jgi:transitional endoplasmic reticulum ATPase